MDATVTLIDVLVADCRARERGGGIGVRYGNLKMTGGAIRNCQALIDGGGIVAHGPAHLSNVMVHGCQASGGGGMRLKETSNHRLINVTIENCQAMPLQEESWGEGGAGILTDADSNLYAEHVHITRCHSGTEVKGMDGGAVKLLGTSTWIDSMFSDCTGSRSIVYAADGTHTFTRIAIVRCLSLGQLSQLTTGGGLQVAHASVIVQDSRIADTGSLGMAGMGARGGCVYFDGFGELVLGNTTLKNCTSQQGPYIWVGGRGTRFRAELLTLEPNCEAEHKESLIYADWAPEEANAFPVHVQGLQVSDGCASSSLVVLTNGYRLSRCSDDDVCGAAATCTENPLSALPNLTTVECSCTGESFPAPAAVSATLAPYGFDPNVDFCVTPRVLTAVDVGGFDLEKVVRLSKTGSTNAAHTLDLTIHMGGTDVYPAIWSIEAASVPSWLSLPLHGDINATEQMGNLSMTLKSSGLAERLAEPYEALLNLSTVSQRNKTVLVLVKLFVTAATVASRSIWGRVTSERECHSDAQADSSITEVVLGEIVSLPFSACDMDGMAVEHDDARSFEAVLIDQRSGTLHPLSIAPDLPGTYALAVQAPHLGEFGLRLSLLAANGSREQVSVERHVRVVCPAAKEPLPSGLGCGCRLGTIFNDEDQVCEPCPVAHYGSKQPGSEAVCLPCPTDATTEVLGSLAIESCRCNSGFFVRNTDGLVHGEGDCLRCLPGTECSMIGLKMQDLPLKAGWWRASNTSLDVRRCHDYRNNAASGCVGGAEAQACKDSLHGPLCVLCKHGAGYYYSRDANECLECGAGTKYVTIIVTVCIGVALFMASGILMHYCSLPVAKACKPTRRTRLKVWVALRSFMVKARRGASNP